MIFVAALYGSIASSPECWTPGGLWVTGTHVAGDSAIRQPIILTLLCLLACSDGPKPAMESVDEPVLACDSCTIKMEGIVDLHEFDETTSILPRTAVVALQKDVLLVGPLGRADRIALVDSLGEAIQVMGRTGAGPGEFADLVMVGADAGDSIVTIDRARISKFTQNFEFLRSAPFRARISGFTTLAQGRLLLNAYQGDSSVFLILNDSLRIIQRLQRSTVNSDSNEFRSAADGLGGFWTARTGMRYELRHYDIYGTPGEPLYPRSDWFPPSSDGRGGVRSIRISRPRPRVNGIVTFGDGLLWVVAVVADTRWQPVPNAVEHDGAKSPSTLSSSELRRLFDSVVEVIDLRTGRVFASRRYDGLLGGITEHGLVWEAVRSADTDVMKLRMMRLSYSPE